MRLAYGRREALEPLCSHENKIYCKNLQIRLIFSTSILKYKH